MPKCKDHDICGLDDEADLEAGLCILHSRASDKDRAAFTAALDAHRKNNGENFARFVFPGHADFTGVRFAKTAFFHGATFTDGADFTGATFSDAAFFHGATFGGAVNFIWVTFSETANFSRTTFAGAADYHGATFTRAANFAGSSFGAAAFFHGATFTEVADFTGATFTRAANFSRATFAKVADFSEATFTDAANFTGTTFSDAVNFNRVTFAGGGDFPETSFKGKSVDFRSSHFRGRTLFASRREEGRTVPIFWGVEVNFKGVRIEPADSMTFLEADLRRCRFQDTDLRGVQMTGVIWPPIADWFGVRFGVFDEICRLGSGEARQWARIERLYHGLKQNREEQRDYERAGDFHCGEKEMRRRNPATPPALRSLLTLYWALSGYGERYLRPLIWAGVLFAISTLGYLVLGLSPGGEGSRLTLANLRDWFHAAHYSLRVMTLLRPDDLVPIGYAKLLHTIQSLLGPLFLGLFALAVRQRLKR